MSELKYYQVKYKIQIRDEEGDVVLEFYEIDDTVLANSKLNARRYYATRLSKFNRITDRVQADIYDVRCVE